MTGHLPEPDTIDRVEEHQAALKGCLEWLPPRFLKATPDVMPTAFTTSPVLHPRDLGSDYGPVLHGVASGLAELFPPIHNSQRLEGEAAGEASSENNESAAES